MDRRLADVEDMIARVALGDRHAFEALYDATSAKLHAVCLSVLKDRPLAEETLQEVFIRVWKNADRYAANGLSPMTWLITIARNRSIDKLRAKKGRPGAAPAEMAEAVPSSAPGPEEMTIRNQQRRMLESCLDEIGSTQAKALRAVYLEGASYAELAQTAGAPINTVRSWLRRGLVQLKDCVSQ
ncbi:sigma-70 family RNA polymerase sigma factor [Paracoccus tegillarcae]|uniref:RNA polymerase subunit sigma n=1 Tax=Paracoccus tegillarcae TaxID=1529068 RepID=A0A2K9EEH1_9RHOB|nr:sigma-70 family RNA polymerase sigma factor [Paracoccus tegillarcae]AUH33358.1 RNA polymerase subunit sigma [Paracoccus tegillarcae]